MGFEVVQTLVVALASIAASSGFWAYMQSKATRESNMNDLIRGIAHAKIVSQGMIHIDRGYITKAEYNDFVKYLYKPYEECGGNGLAERIMVEVSKLPLRNDDRYRPPVQNYERDNRD